jgi:hypothetical protein
MDTWRQMDNTGRLGATWAHRPAPFGRRSAPQVPWHLPRHQSMGATPQALPCVDLSQFASMVMMIHGSTIIDLEPSNRPPNHFTGQIFARAAFATTFGSQPRPYDRKAVKSRADQRPTYAAWRPTFTTPPLL